MKSRERTTKKLILVALASVVVFLLGALPAFCDRLWTTIGLEGRSD